MMMISPTTLIAIDEDVDFGASSRQCGHFVVGLSYHLLGDSEKRATCSISSVQIRSTKGRSLLRLVSQ